jgi:hypothetical protein
MAVLELEPVLPNIDHESLNKLGEKALNMVDPMFAVKSYQLSENYSSLLAAGHLEAEHELALLCGKIHSFFGDSNAAQVSITIRPKLQLLIIGSFFAFI